MKQSWWSGCAALLAAALGTGCSGEPEPGLELGVVRQAVTFPPTASWIPVQQTGINMGDPVTDGANNGREVVGSAAFPAVFIYADDTSFQVRLRLDATPLSGSNV